MLSYAIVRETRIPVRPKLKNWISPTPITNSLSLYENKNIDKQYKTMYNKICEWKFRYKIIMIILDIDKIRT